MSQARSQRPPRAVLSIPDAAWSEALRREAVVRPLAAMPRLGRAAVEGAARHLSLSPSQVYRLIRAFRRKPVTATLAPGPPGPSRGTGRLAAAVESQITAAIDGAYFRAERPRLSRVHAVLAAECRAAGLAPPSLKAVRARVAARTARERASAREGTAAAGDRFRQVGIGLRTERPLQVAQVDHTLVDVQLVDEAGRAPIGRPWLTLVLDVHTRLVLGFHVALDPPSAAGAALAVAGAVLPKAAWLADRGLSLAWPAEGRPERIHVDNGREFHSRAFGRGCRQHGIALDHRPPATPRFGGHIERFMGTLMARVHGLPGSTFSNPVERGGYPSEARAVLTLREFEHLLALEVLGPYHNEVHAALGRTPLSAWNEGTRGMDLRPPPDADAFVLDFLPFEERLVRRDGVRLFNVLYQDGALAHLVHRGGIRVRVKYDPRDLSAVLVELPGGDHVRVRTADLARPPVTLWEHREACRRLRTEGRRTVDEEAIFAAIAEGRRVLAEAGRLTRAERRAAARTGAALATAGESGAPSAAPSSRVRSDDPDARVPMPEPGANSGVEFW